MSKPDPLRPAGLGRSRRRAIGAVGAAALGALLLCTARSQALTASPDFRVEVRYDDHLSRIQPGVSPMATVVAPEFKVIGMGRVWWEVWGRQSVASYYLNRPVVSNLASRVSLKAAYAMAEHDSIEASYRFVRSRDPLQFDERSVMLYEGTSKSIGTARLKLWRGEASLRFRHWDYLEPDLADGTHRRFEIAGFPMRTRSTTGAVAFRRVDLHVADRGLTSDAATVWLRRSHAATLRSEVEVGAAQLRYDDGSEDQWRWVGGVGITREIRSGRRWTLAQVRVARDIVTEVRARVERGDGLGRVAVTWQKDLDVEGGVCSDPTVNRRWVIDVNRELPGNKLLLLRGSYGRTQGFRSGGNDTRIYRTSAAVEWPLGLRLKGRTSYEFLRQLTEQPEEARNFHRNKVIVSVEAKF